MPKTSTTLPNAWQNESEMPDERPHDWRENQRNASFWNTRAGGIYFKSTRGEEAAQFYFKHGAHLKFDRSTTDFISKTPIVFHSNEEISMKAGGNFIFVGQHSDLVNYGDVYQTVGDYMKWQPLAEKILRKYQSDVHPIKQLFPTRRTRIHNSIDQSELQVKEGAFKDCPHYYNEYDVLEVLEPRRWIPENIKNCDLPVLPDPSVNRLESDPAVLYGIISGYRSKQTISCLTCYGTDLSPSSEDGYWTPEGMKNDLKDAIVSFGKDIFDYESDMGTPKTPEGGSTMYVNAKNYQHTVGLVKNTSESFRKDPYGRLVPFGIKLDILGNTCYRQYKEVPLIEKVHCQEIVGGMYNLIAGDRFKLDVGANGINIKTLGDIAIGGIQTNISSETIGLHSGADITLYAPYIDIQGEVIALRPRLVKRTIEDNVGNFRRLVLNDKYETEPEQQVLVDGNLNIAMNAIIAGGMHVEGEVTLQHITAPCEYQITDSDFEYAGIGAKQTFCKEGDACEKDNIIHFSYEKNWKDENIIKGPTLADLLPDCIIGENCNEIELDDGSTIPIGAIKIRSVCAPNSVRVHPHYHWFKNLPLHLMSEDPIEPDKQLLIKQQVGDHPGWEKPVDSHQMVRAMGSRNNWASINKACPIVDSLNPYHVLYKFEK